MHKKFNSSDIEKKWQEKWREDNLHTVSARDAKKEKEYVLVEWPYPSGNLHIGHWYAFAVPDIYVRHGRMTGKEMLFPMGFDAFGLPAENAALKHGKSPREWTEGNIAFMKEQLERMGNSFSWDKTANSTDPSYYAMTQWMFTEFFNKGIVYRGVGIVNWCPKCNTVIANEQVTAAGECERCGTMIEKKELPQWMMRITDYADRLIDDLDALNWPEHIKEAQRRWIGRSEGAEIDFKLDSGQTITAFTTRPDTLFGVTYLVLAPEHKLVNELSPTNKDEVQAYVKAAAQKSEIDRTNAEKEKTGVKLEGVSAVNPATGNPIPVFVADYVLASYGTGAIMAVPAHDERDFAFAEKYNLPVVQTIVPCADDSRNPPQRDLPEVKRDTVIVHLRNKETGKYALLNWHQSLEGITTAIMGGIEDGNTPEEAALNEIAEEAGILNARIIKKSPVITAARYCASHKGENRCALSQVLLAEVDSLAQQKDISEEERKKHTLVWVDEQEILTSLTPDHQKLVWTLLHEDKPIIDKGSLTNSGEFDGMDSEEAKQAIADKVGGRMTNTYRLRDWSIGRQRYWGVPIPIVYDPEGKAYPVPKEHLPWTLPEDVDFTPTGEPPLAKSEVLKKRTEEIFGVGWRPEVETMDTFVDSSWYFLRYLDNENSELPVSKKAQEDWMQVDIYFGGAEHTTMHLLYSRFWQKALFDLGLVLHEEPYLRRINRGLILGPDGNKMSKSKGNVIDPDEQVSRVGADTVKMYLAFMGPYGEVTNYPWDMGGIAGTHRFLERVYGMSEHIVDNEPEAMTRLLHKTIAKVSADVPQFKFNTAISAMMQYVNAVEKEGVSNESYELFLRTLAPFAPHLTEELWAKAGYKSSIHTEEWPAADKTLLTESEITIGVQINGKVRGDITIAPDATEEVALAAAKAEENVAKWITESGDIKKVIYRPGKILNIVVG